MTTEGAGPQPYGSATRVHALACASSVSMLAVIAITNKSLPDLLQHLDSKRS